MENEPWSLYHINNGVFLLLSKTIIPFEMLSLMHDAIAVFDKSSIHIDKKTTIVNKLNMVIIFSKSWVHWLYTWSSNVLYVLKDNKML